MCGKWWGQFLPVHTGQAACEELCMSCRTSWTGGEEMEMSEREKRTKNSQLKLLFYHTIAGWFGLGGTFRCHPAPPLP